MISYRQMSLIYSQVRAENPTTYLCCLFWRIRLAVGFWGNLARWVPAPAYHWIKLHVVYHTQSKSKVRTRANNGKTRSIS
jgi:hypothetical protein